MMSANPEGEVDLRQKLKVCGFALERKHDRYLIFDRRRAPRRGEPTLTRWGFVSPIIVGPNARLDDVRSFVATLGASA
jgi:hypothetical protein